MNQDNQERLEALKRAEKALKEVGMFGALQQKKSVESVYLPSTVQTIYEV